MNKKAVQFGAGNIGRGFIGALLSKSGYHVTFADVIKDTINEINKQKKYTVYVMDVDSYDYEITDIDAVDSSCDDVLLPLVDANVVTTAVGLTNLNKIAPTIAKSIDIRMKKGVSSFVNVIACENALMATTQLKKSIFEHLDSDAQKYAEKYIGFANCSVDKIVPPVKTENPIDVVVEKYDEWNVEACELKGKLADKNSDAKIDGMNYADNLISYVERKLFTLNTGHAVCAYLGFINNLETIDKALENKEIFNIVWSAMRESGAGLIKKYNMDADAHYAYIEKNIKRFQNPHLNDDVTRVGREPIRKLSPNDRLVKPLITAYDYGLDVDNLILGVGAALHYNNPDDSQSVELQEKIAKYGLMPAVMDITSIADKDLLSKIENAYYNLLKD